MYLFLCLVYNSAMPVVQTAEGCWSIGVLAHEDRLMRPMYAILYSHPSRVGPIIK